MAYIERVNDLHPELLAIHSLNAVSMDNSPPRGVMFAGHFAQRPVIEGSEPDLLQTGVAEEFGKYTFGIRMPEDGTIVRLIDRYPTQGIGIDPIGFNPETVVIYRSHETGLYDCFTVPYYASLHPTFGFKYEMKAAARALAVGREFEKDTVFADSPAVKGESHYTYGRNLNVAYMSHPNVGLDGYVISRDVLDHFKFRVYVQRQIGFGGNTFPLNLYGDDEVYKPLPDIGDMVREDGLLMVTRRFDEHLSPAMLSKKDLRTVSYVFDNKVYARAGEGRVVDISVIKSENVSRQLPPEMTTQLEKYANAGQRFHREIVRFEEQLIAEDKSRGGTGRVPISRKLKRLIVESKGVINYRTRHPRSNLQLTYRREPLNNWLVNITVEYIVTPNRGFKFTCCSGGKGVLCRIEEPENMPVDADGNRADIISGPDSIPGRMNLGRLFHPYFTGAARDVRRQVLEELGYDRHFRGPVIPEDLMAIPDERWQRGIGTMLKFAQIVSPTTYHEYMNVLNDEERLEWVMRYINEDRPYVHMPIRVPDDVPGNRFFHDEMVLEIEKHFKLTYGPVTYVGRSGRKVTTINKVRIAPLYFMLLDKIADSWLSADLGKHNNFGILAAMNKADKYSTPWRFTPPRNISETEGRLYRMYAPKRMIAEMIDRSGNLASQRMIGENIIEAEEPTQIKEIIDREVIPFDSARPNQMVHHVFRCAGFAAVYSPEERP